MQNRCQCYPVLLYHGKQQRLLRCWRPIRRRLPQIFVTVRVRLLDVERSPTSLQMGFNSTRILLFQSINSIIALIGEACCVFWIDATGRRRPLIIGNIASGLSFVVGAILMARYPGTVDKYVLKL